MFKKLVKEKLLSINRALCNSTKFLCIRILLFFVSIIYGLIENGPSKKAVISVEKPITFDCRTQNPPFKLKTLLKANMKKV